LASLFGKAFQTSYTIKNTASRAPTRSVGVPAKAERLLGWRATRNLNDVVRNFVNYTKRVAIVGAGVGGSMLLEAIQGEAVPGVHVVGFFDDDLVKVGTEVRGVPVLGTIADLNTAVSQYRITSVVISAPSVGKDFIQRVTEVLPPGFPVKILPSISSVILGRV